MNPGRDPLLVRPTMSGLLVAVTVASGENRAEPTPREGMGGDGVDGTSRRWVKALKANPPPI